MSGVPISKKFQEVAEARRRNGWPTTLRWLGRRVVRRFLGLDVVNVIWLDAAAFRGSLQVEPGLTARFLTPDEIRAYAADPLHDLFPEMADRAAAGKDLCFAILEGRRLAAYGWYAPQCIEAEHNFGVAMSYPADVFCMYKAFTHEAYRGRRLHGLVVGLGLAALGARGARRLVSTVEWTNLASLKSFFRLGYVDLGRIVTLRWAGGSSFFPAAAEKRQVRFGRAADLGPRR